LKKNKKKDINNTRPIKRKHSFPKKSKTSLHKSCIEGRANEVIDLLEKGTDIEAI